MMTVDENRLILSWPRVLICCVLLLVTGLAMHTLDRSRVVPLQRPLGLFPLQIGPWKALGDQTLDQGAARVLGVDDYVFRNYQGPGGWQINFYASYFSHVDRTKGYHSPLNCMPGSGWDVFSSQVIELALESGKRIKLRKVLIVNGDQKQLGLYWYQCRGRFLPTEYLERIYRVWDSMTLGRTDGAFIRLLLPVRGDEQQSLTVLTSFARTVIPVLEQFLP